MRFDRNDYSVPTAYAHQEAVVILVSARPLALLLALLLARDHNRVLEAARAFIEGT